MKKILALLIMVFLASYAHAAPSTSISIPNSFTPNTTIQSSQVNSNFNEVQSQYNSHSHTDITSLGAITTGSWLATVVGTTYGGTGQNFGSTAQGSVIYFSGAGTMASLTPGTAGQVLSTNGAGANPSWTTAGGRDVINRGFEASASVGSAYLTVYSGSGYVGTTSVNVATTTVLTFATAGFWSSGSVVTYAGGAGWCSYGVDSNGYVKLLGPAKAHWSDTSKNSSGTNLYFWEQSTNTTYRVLGDVRINTANQVANSYSQVDNMVMYDIPVNVDTTVTAGAWRTASCAASIPPSSKRGIFGLQNGSVANATVGIWIRPTGTTWSTNSANGIRMDAGGDPSGEIAGSRTCFTSDTQSIDYYNAAASNSTRVDTEGYYYSIR